MSGEHCQPISQKEQQINAVLAIFGPTAYINEYKDGYYVIYTRPDGNMFAANLNAQFQRIGQDKHLGHESNISNIPYDRQFTFEELMNAGKSFNG